MNNRKTTVPLPVAALCALCFMALLVSSCATSKFSLPANPLSIAGDGASCYIVLPVDANRALVDLLAKKITDGDGIPFAIDRTRIVYAGSFPDGSFRMSATGSFPASASAFAFSSAKGWTKKGSSDTGIWYHSERIDAAIPVSGLVCIARGEGNLESMLANLREGAPVDISPAFAEYVANAALDGRIGLFIRDAVPLVSALLGPDVSLPVNYAEVFAKRDIDTECGEYLVSASIVMSDARTARAMTALLKLALSCDVRSDAERVYLSGFRVSAGKLAEMSDSLYFR